MTPLEKSILATLVYYDTIGLPLTSFEIYRYLINPRHFSFKINQEDLSLSEIYRALKAQSLKKIIEYKDGFYFLKGRGDLVSQRIKANKIVNQKWRKIKLIVKFFQVFPYLRLIAISGSLAVGNAKPESDIDFLVVAKHGRIWTCRTFLSLFLQILGKRRHGRKTKDRICLNHFISDNSLKIKLPSLYNAQTYAHLIPLLEISPLSFKDFFYRSFTLDRQSVGDYLFNQIYQSNSWLGSYLFFKPQIRLGHRRRLATRKVFCLIQNLLEQFLDKIFGDRLEKKLSIWQKRRIKKDPLTYRKGGRVRTDKFALEFHPDSPEKNILENHNQKLKELGFPELAIEKDSGLRKRNALDKS